MGSLETYRAVIDLWRKRAALARYLGVEPAVVRGWYKRDAIPEGHWNAIEKAARKCGFEGVSYRLLNGFVPGASIRADREGDPAPR